MAGNERSGRRPLEPTTGDIPPVGTSYKSVKRFIRAITDAIVKGGIDPRIGEAALKGARDQLRALRDQHGPAELEEYRDLVKRAEELELRALAREAADRRHATTPTNPNDTSAGLGEEAPAGAAPPPAEGG